VGLCTTMAGSKEGAGCVVPEFGCQRFQCHMLKACIVHVRQITITRGTQEHVVLSLLVVVNR
jgi:hypothetical protein